MRLLPPLCGLTIVLALSPVLADEVVLINGDRLSGRIHRVQDGQLIIRTDLAGEVSVSLDDVSTFATDEPIEIHFRDGTVLHRRVLAADEGAFAIEEDEVLRAQTFDLQQIDTINPEPFEVRWTGDFTAGLLLARGDSDSENINFSFNLARRAEDDRITLGAEYYYARQRDPDDDERRTTQDNWRVTAQYDYFFTEKLYGYTNVLVERDRIADLDLRLAPGVGLGYQWVETDRMTLSTEGGLTWFYELYDDGDDRRTSLALRLAYDLERRLTERVRLFHNLEYFPTIDDFSDYLIKTQIGVRSTLTRRLFAELKTVVDYDSTPAVGAERLNVRYVVGVGYRF